MLPRKDLEIENQVDETFSDFMGIWGNKPFDGAIMGLKPNIMAACLKLMGKKKHWSHSHC